MGQSALKTNHRQAQAWCALLFALVSVLSRGLATADEDAAANDNRNSTVGRPAAIDQLVIPGSELIVVPAEDSNEPFVLRIVETFRHGTDHRYDFVYSGLEPGTYDLRDYLRRKDGSSMSDVPEILVTVEAVLPPGQVEPHPLTSEPVAFFSGYRLMMIAGGVVWVAGLVLILFGWRRKSTAHGPDAAQGLTLADRLQPMIERAVKDELSDGELAELERMMLAFWRRRLQLEQAPAVEAMAALRSHEEAGALLRQFDQWLHQPSRQAEVDVEALLQPYRTLPADALDGACPLPPLRGDLFPRER